MQLVITVMDSLTLFPFCLLLCDTEFIEDLIRNNHYLAAVGFVCAFNLMDKFPLDVLLKRYLRVSECLLLIFSRSQWLTGRYVQLSFVNIHLWLVVKLIWERQGCLSSNDNYAGFYIILKFSGTLIPPISPLRWQFVIFSIYGNLWPRKSYRRKIGIVVTFSHLFFHYHFELCIIFKH